MCYLLRFAASSFAVLTTVFAGLSGPAQAQSDATIPTTLESFEASGIGLMPLATDSKMNFVEMSTEFTISMDNPGTGQTILFSLSSKPLDQITDGDPLGVSMTIPFDFSITLADQDPLLDIGGGLGPAISLINVGSGVLSTSYTVLANTSEDNFGILSQLPGFFMDFPQDPIPLGGDLNNDGSDNFLVPGDTFTTGFDIGLQQPAPFTFFVDAFGTINPPFEIDLSGSGELSQQVLFPAVPEPGASMLATIGILASLGHRRRDRSAARLSS